MFSLLYRHTDDGVFDHFSKISDHFLKISEDSPKLVRRSAPTFLNIFRKFSKIAKDFRGRPEDISMIQQRI